MHAAERKYGNLTDVSCPLYEKLITLRKLMERRSEVGDEVIEAAEKFNQKLFGGRIELYGISYISDKCINDCAYCGHNSGIKYPRRTLTESEMKLDFEAVLKNSPDEFCILAGEHPGIIDDCVRALKILLEANALAGGKLKCISFNIAPQRIEDFRKLVEANKSDIPLQYRIFQELYDSGQYAKYHSKGPKSVHANRLFAQGHALLAGFDRAGMGVLLGLHEKNEPYPHAGHDSEIVSLISHAYRLKEDTGQFPYSVSIPRHQPVKGYDFATPNPVDDERYRFYHALLRLALPQTKIIITSRETPEMIRRLEPLTNIRDLAPRPGVGGNFRTNAVFQNELGDARAAEEIIRDLRERGKLL